MKAAKDMPDALFFPDFHVFTLSTLDRFNGHFTLICLFILSFESFYIDYRDNETTYRRQERREYIRQEGF